MRNDRSRGHRRIKSALLACCFAGVGAPAALSAEYRLDVGDVIEISVVRIPELQRRVSVKPDGNISYPMLGQFSVAGLLPSEVETKIQTMLATKVFRQRLSDGRELAVTIEPDEVTAFVAQYRPVYVNGDVSKPGEQPFRPSMTVRQAVSLSGGYDMLHQRMDNPILLSADLKGEYQALWAEFVKEHVHIARLKAELGDKDALDQLQLPDSPVAPAQLSEILNIESDRLKSDQADYEREKVFLQRSIKQGDEQVKVLSAQEQKEEQGTDADIEELQRVTDLFGKGSLPSPRVTESRRAVLLSSTRKLQTAAQLMQVKKQQDDVTRQLERLDDQRKIKLLQELQETRMTFSRVRAKLQSTGEKLQYAAAKSQNARGKDIKPDVLLIRKGKNGSERIAADEDAELQPGDVVEIALRSDYTVGMDYRSPADAYTAMTTIPFVPSGVGPVGIDATARRDRDTLAAPAASPVEAIRSAPSRTPPPPQRRATGNRGSGAAKAD